jgi:hypothetical protein
MLSGALPEGESCEFTMQKFFSRVQFEPLEMPDVAGKTHRFHFEVRLLLGDRVALE